MARMICDHAKKCKEPPIACPAATPHDRCNHGGGEAFYCFFVRAKVRRVKAKEG